MSRSERPADERSHALLTVAAPVAMVVAYWATRDALFLGSFDVGWLPQVLAVSAVAALLIALPVARAVGRFGPGSVLRGSLVAGAGVCLILWWVASRSAGAAAFLLYATSDVLASVLAAVHGVLLTERVGARQLQRHRPALLAAVVLGAAVGGGVGEVAAVRGQAMAMLPVLALLQVIVAIGVPARSAPARGAAANAAPAQADRSLAAAGASGVPAARTTGMLPLVRIAVRTPYLRTLGLVIFVASACAIPFDYALKAQVGSRLMDAAGLLRFFAAFYVAAALIGYLLQGLLGRPALERLGLAGTLSALPVGLLVGGGSLLLVPGLGGVAFARGLELAARRALFRPASALLYTPLPVASRRAVRSLIEIVAERLGEAACGGTIVVLALVTPEFGVRSLAIVALVIAAVAALAIRRLQSAYLGALEQSLSRRAVQLDQDSVQDRTTRKLVESLHLADLPSTWHESSLAIPVGELRRLLAERDSSPGATPPPAPSSVRARGVDRPPQVEPGLDRPPQRQQEREVEPRRKDASVGEPRATALPAGRSSGDAPGSLQPAATAIAALQSNDPQRIRAVLEAAGGVDRALVPYLIPLLSRDDVAVPVVETLRRNAAQVIGMLVDVLLDPEEPIAVRRRIPRILAVTASPRTVAGLLHGLEDARSEIRLQCGRALARLHVAHPELVFERDQVMSLVLAEARRGKRVWESQQILELAEEREDSPLVDEVLRDRANRSLEHVFTLLSLVLPLEPLRIAFAGLHTDDAVLRNTALEYLDTVLPPDVRSSLWPLLADRGTTLSAPQPANQALADLIGSNQSIQINLAELRRRLGRDS